MSEYPEPTFVDGIGPPLEQIWADYTVRLEDAERDAKFRGVPECFDAEDEALTCKDVLALIEEVWRLRRA